MLLAVAVLALGAGSATAETDLSGTWRLDEAASRTAPGAVFTGLVGSAPAPNTLYVTQARNGTLVIGSDMNTSHARNYNPGGESTTTLSEGELRVVSAWDGDTLEAEGGMPTSNLRLRERIARSPDGSSLTVDITRSDGEGEHHSHLVYRRIDAEGPCETWPTPCKDWSDKVAR
jgi:hypothetical protein